MIVARSFPGKTVAVFGLARTGLASVRALKAGGANVIAWDDNSAARDAGVGAGAEIAPWREWNWDGIAALILSPGVPLTHPKPHEIVTHARAANVSVIGDVDLTGDDTESHVALRLRALEAKISSSPAVVGAVLSLSAPDETSLS